MGRSTVSVWAAHMLTTLALTLLSTIARPGVTQREREREREKEREREREREREKKLNHNYNARHQQKQIKAIS